MITKLYPIPTIVMPPNSLQILLKIYFPTIYFHTAVFCSYIYSKTDLKFPDTQFMLYVPEIQTMLYKKTKKTNGKPKSTFLWKKKKKTKGKEDKFNMGQCLILIILVKYYLKFKGCFPFFFVSFLFFLLNDANYLKWAFQLF